MSQSFSNLSCKGRTNIELKQELTSLANKTYVNEPICSWKKVLIWRL